MLCAESICTHKFVWFEASRDKMRCRPPPFLWRTETRSPEPHVATRSCPSDPDLTAAVQNGIGRWRRTYVISSVSLLRTVVVRSVFVYELLPLLCYYPATFREHFRACEYSLDPWSGVTLKRRGWDIISQWPLVAVYRMLGASVTWSSESMGGQTVRKIAFTLTRGATCKATYIVMLNQSF
jgi:hypothetical protein